MKLITEIRISIESLYVGDDAEKAARWETTFETPDWTPGLERLREELDGVRDLRMEPDPRGPGYGTDLVLTVNAREFVGEEFWDDWRAQRREDRLPITAVEAVEGQLMESAFDEHLSDTLSEALRAQGYDCTAATSFTVGEPGTTFSRAPQSAA